MVNFCKTTVQKIVLIIVIAVSCFNLHAQTLQLVKDINQTSFGFSSYPFDFNILNGKLFFLADDNSGAYGLWSTDGTTAGTIKLSPSSGTLNSISDIIVYNSKIYFAYNDGINGEELWISDGTVAGTKLFKDLYVGSTGSYPSAFTVTNNKLFFMANDINGERRLYASDGTVAGTIAVRNNYIDLFNGFTDFAVYNNNIYFTSDDGTGSGYGLWKSDGTIGGTVLVYSNTEQGFVPATLGSNYAVYNNKLYFSGSDNVYGGELWVTDGSAAGTHIVVNLASDNIGEDVYGNGSPAYLQVYNGMLYFSGNSDAYGYELFKTDGTAAGTQIVKDITPGPVGSGPSTNIVYNGFLYFSTGGDSAGLWRTDGTDAGTIPVKTGLYNFHFAGIFNGELYIVLGTSDGNAIWQSDGSTAGTKPIVITNSINPVSDLSIDFRFIDYNSALYLSASNQDITVGYELCKITNAVLAVNLLSFTGKTDGNEDVLSWTTNKSTTDHYVIQKSTNGNIFSSLGVVKAAANKTGNTTYSFTCASAGNAAGYYRLQLADKDGSVTYSKVIKLQRNNSYGITAFYNTAAKQINIINSTNAACTWKLFSSNGSPVKYGNSNDHTIQINTTGIASGVYIILCEAGGKLINTRIAVF